LQVLLPSVQHDDIVCLLYHTGPEPTASSQHW